MVEQNETKQLVVIDGTAFVYRGFYAFSATQELSTSTGQPTSAIYNFTTMLLKLLREEQPGYLAVCFDRGGKSGRTEILAEYKADHPELDLADYKADRPEPPDSLISQFEYIRKIIKALGIPIVEMEEYEADDVAGTLAKRAEAAGFDVLIMTNDKDMLQLISPQIKVYRVNRNGHQIFDTEVCKARYGVEPRQIPDYLALLGDTVDRIPGVAGIGEKSIPQMLAEFDTVENLLENLQEVKKQWRAKLEAGKELALLGKQLVPLNTELDIPVTLEECKIGETDQDALMELFRELEFNSLRNQIAAELTNKQEQSNTYKTVTTEAELDALLEKLKGVKEFSVVLQTTLGDPIRSELVGIAISTTPHEGYYIPVLNNALGAPDLLPTQRVLEGLRPIFEDDAYQKTGYNIKADLKVLRRSGVDLKGIAFDTMIAASLLSPSAANQNLEDLAFANLNHQMISIRNLIGRGKKQIAMDLVPLPQVTAYACETVDIALRLKQKFEPELAGDGLSDIFRDIELALIPVLADMELTGITVDSDYLRQLSEEFQERLDQKMDQIYGEAGREFNINSTQQLGHILFEELGLPKNLTRRTKTGYSTNVQVLEKLALHHPLPELILEYRTAGKLKATYTDALIGLINPDTGRIHTSFHQAVARTGRLSSSHPNLQNIPVRTPEGREIRRAFVADDDDHTLVVVDYSQIELRILAHLSGDERLHEAFAKDMDIHAQAAALLFGVAQEDIDADMRRQAKTMNYGIIYGIGPFRLSNELKIEFDEAQGLIDNYFNTYAGVRVYFDQLIESAQGTGYVETMLGRRCYVPELKAGDRNTQESGKRIAINAPMQGTAAELMKIAMLRIHEYLANSGGQTKMLLQVHDELVFEAPRAEQDEVISEIKRLMENACPIDVPVKVDIHAGENWLEAK